MVAHTGNAPVLDAYRAPALLLDEWALIFLSLTCLETMIDLIDNIDPTISTHHFIVSVSLAQGPQ